MPAQFQGLFEGHLDQRGVTFGDSLAPQHDDVDALIGHAVMAQRSCDPPCRVFRVLRLEPRQGALLQLLHNAIGDAFVYVLFHCLFSLAYGLRCCCNPTGHPAMRGMRPSQAAGGVRGISRFGRVLKSGDTPRRSPFRAALTDQGP